jgi:RNA polymerase subunit RPABC4/transcription elongation factor Spt4
VDKLDRRNQTVISIDSCKKCGKTILEEWTFCPYCRREFETIPCPLCQQIIKTSWDFCPYCKESVKNNPIAETSFEKANDWLRAVLKDK